MSPIGRPTVDPKDKVMSNGFTARQWVQVVAEATSRHLSYADVLREAWDVYYAKQCTERAKAGEFDALK